MTSKLYVGNLNYQITDSALTSAFSAFGQVESVNIIKDRETDRPRGFAFVEMSNDKDAQAAIDGLNGTDLDGRSLTVNEVKPRENRGGGGGGGGGRGGW